MTMVDGSKKLSASRMPAKTPFWQDAKRQNEGCGEKLPLNEERGTFVAATRYVVIIDTRVYPSPRHGIYGFYFQFYQFVVTC